MTDRLTLEFTVEPFVPAEPGPHVTASIDAARSVANEPIDVGPFGTTATGSKAEVLEMTNLVLEAAFSNGASRVSFQITTDPTKDEQ